MIFTDATSNVPARKKRHHTKVKSGCITCKIRKIKCDERRPACVRCTSTGRTCDGYLDVPKSLSFEICTDTDEKWAFHYFRDRTVNHVVSFSEHGLWDRLVLQASYSQEVIRRMIVAIGAYHEAVDVSIADRIEGQRLLAIKQYNRAISKFIQELPNMSTGDVLLTSIVLTFFENIRGNMDAAVKHLYAGLAILSERRKSRTRNVGFTDVIEKDLAPILASLHISAATLIPFFSTAQDEVTVPESFDSLKTAHESFYTTVQSISEKLDSTFQQDPRKEYSKDLQSLTRGMLGAWRIAFEELKRSPSTATSPRFYIGIGHLESQYLASSIRLDCALNGSEMTFDFHHAEFRQILSACQNMVSILKTRAYSEPATVAWLGFEPTYISTVLFVAQRCRDPAIRRTAIALLRSHHRMEAFWHTGFIAEVSEFIMQLEEAEALVQPPASSDEIPITARLQFMSASFFAFDAQKQKFKVSYDYWKPDLLKLCMLRHSFDKHEPLHVEDFWLDRRKVKLPRLPQDIPYPEEVIGLFPQVKQFGGSTNLWAHFKPLEPTAYLQGALLNHIYTPPVDLKEPNYQARWKAADELEQRRRVIGQYLSYTKT